MKKLAVLFIAAVLMVSFAGSSVMAKEKTSSGLKGMITAIDTKANTVTIQDSKGAATIVTADATQIASLKSGEMIKVVLKADGKTAEKFVEVMKKKEKK
jgi:hypothetical protein